MSLTRRAERGRRIRALSGRLPVFIATAVVVLGGIAWIWWRLKPRSTWSSSPSDSSRGATGNLIDRAIAGRVTDFFDVGWWPVFNIADIALDVGVAVLLVWLLFSGEETGADPLPPAADEGSEAAL